MRKILLTAFVSSLLFTGCKEIGPAINLSAAVSVDSSWIIVPAPATDPHNVLVEEFSGQSCPNCPAGHATIDAAETASPGRVNAIVIYPYGPPQAIPPIGSAYHFQDSFANSLSNYVTSSTISALPSAMIDRVSSGGFIIQQGSSSWSGIITGQLPVVDSVNLAVQSSYNTTTMTATITATVVYTQPVTTKQNLSIVIVEDSMYSIQEDGSAPSGFDSSYLYTDVFRDMVSAQIAGGDPILDTVSLKVAGQAYKRTYTYKLRSVSPAIVPNHCRVIAFVNSTTNYQVMQSAQTKLTGP